MATADFREKVKDFVARKAQAEGAKIFEREATVYNCLPVSFSTRVVAEDLEAQILESLRSADREAALVDLLGCDELPWVIQLLADMPELLHDPARHVGQNLPPPPPPHNPFTPPRAAPSVPAWLPFIPRAEPAAPASPPCAPPAVSPAFSSAGPAVDWEAIYTMNRACFERSQAADRRSSARKAPASTRAAERLCSRRATREDPLHVLRQPVTAEELFQAAEAGAPEVARIGARARAQRDAGCAVAREALAAGGLSADGWTGLMRACLRGDAAVVRALLDFGADARRSNAYGQTALEIAVAGGRRGLVAALLTAGSGRTLPEHDYGALRAALRSSDPQMTLLVVSDDRRAEGGLCGLDALRRLFAVDALERARLERALEESEHALETAASAQQLLAAEQQVELALDAAHDAALREVASAQREHAAEQRAEDLRAELAELQQQACAAACEAGGLQKKLAAARVLAQREVAAAKEGTRVETLLRADARRRELAAEERASRAEVQLEQLRRLQAKRAQAVRQAHLAEIRGAQLADVRPALLAQICAGVPLRSAERRAAAGPPPTSTKAETKVRADLLAQIRAGVPLRSPAADPTEVFIGDTDDEWQRADARSTGSEWLFLDEEEEAVL